MTTVAVRSPKPRAAVDDRWELRLYVAGQTPRSIAAFAHLEQICEEHLHGRYSIEVIDLLENPTLAVGDQIIAIPTVVRRLPAPMKKIIGDLSNVDRVIVGLDLNAVAKPVKAPAKPRAKKKAMTATKAKAR